MEIVCESEYVGPSTDWQLSLSRLIRSFDEQAGSFTSFLLFHHYSYSHSLLSSLVEGDKSQETTFRITYTV